MPDRPNSNRRTAMGALSSYVRWRMFLPRKRRNVVLVGSGVTPRDSAPAPTQRGPLSQLVASAAQVCDLSGVPRQLDGFVIGGARLLAAAQPAQQIGPGRMVGVIAS